jgi:hypothetical protein
MELTGNKYKRKQMEKQKEVNMALWIYDQQKYLQYSKTGTWYLHSIVYCFSFYFLVENAEFQKGCLLSDLHSDRNLPLAQVSL